MTVPVICISTKGNDKESSTQQSHYNEGNHSHDLDPVRKKLHTTDDQTVKYFKSVSTFCAVTFCTKKIYRKTRDPRTCSNAIKITEALGNEWLHGEKEKKERKKSNVQ